MELVLIFCFMNRSTSLRLPRAGAKGRVLSCYAASRAPAVSLRSSGSLHASPVAQPLSPLGLRQPCGLPPWLRKPFRLRFASPWVLLRGPRNPSVSSAAPGATYGVSLRGLRSPLAPSLRSDGSRGEEEFFPECYPEKFLA